MPSLRKNSLALLCLLLTCCQKVDLTFGPEDGNNASGNSTQTADIVGTGEGTKERPLTVRDVRSMHCSGKDTLWVVGYMVGTARQSMNNAVFSAEASNSSNILLSYNRLCTDTAQCIPVELPAGRIREQLSLPSNVSNFRQCVLVRGIPSIYLRRKGLRNCSAGLWIIDFDLSAFESQDWGSTLLQPSQ